MLDKLKPKSDFTRNVLTLMTGTTIAQAIPIAISPILTRMYTPEDFGVLALFVAMTSIFAVIANGRYELAIMLPKKEEDAIQIMALGFIITLFLTSMLFFMVFFFQERIVRLLENEAIASWLYLVPASVFLMGSFNLLNYFSTRKKLYKELAKARVLRSITLAIVQVSLGFFKVGAVGLLSGQLLSQIVVNIRLVRRINLRHMFSHLRPLKMWALAKRYKAFPLFSMWGILANSLSRNLMSVMIPLFFSIQTLGLYSLVQRLLEMPSALVGGALGQVFFQEASKEKQKTGQVIHSFLSTLKKLLLIGLPVFTVLFLMVEEVFAFVFGEEWRIAGTYAKEILPLFFIRFVIVSISSVDTIMERQNIFLLFNLILLGASLLVIYLSRDLSFDRFLMHYMWVMGSIYLAYGYVLYKMAKNEFRFGRI